MAEYALQHPTVARILRAQPIGHNPFQIESLDGTDKIRISVAGLEKEQVRDLLDVFRQVVAETIVGKERSVALKYAEASRNAIETTRREIQERFELRNESNGNQENVNEDSSSSNNSSTTGGEDQTASVIINDVELEVLIEKLKYYERQASFHEASYELQQNHSVEFWP